MLITAFVLVQRRSLHPLLPLRVLADRDRVGAYLALLTSSVAMFGMFLFLTYYLQESLGFSAVQNGVAYLPMIVITTVGSTYLSGRLVRRLGAKVVLPLGMLTVAASLLLLTRLGAHSSYLVDVLPALVLLGLGFGLAISPAINLGTSRIDGPDAGVASALVNTAQQVGGSIVPRRAGDVGRIGGRRIHRRAGGRRPRRLLGYVSVVRCDRHGGRCDRRRVGPWASTGVVSVAGAGQVDARASRVPRAPSRCSDARRRR